MNSTQLKRPSKGIMLLNISKEAWCKKSDSMCTNLYDTTAEDDDSNPEKTCKSRRAADAVGGDCTGDPGARVDASVRHHQLVPVQVAQSSEDALGGFSDYVILHCGLMFVTRQ